MQYVALTPKNDITNIISACPPCLPVGGAGGVQSRGTLIKMNIDDIRLNWISENKLWCRKIALRG